VPDSPSSRRVPFVGLTGGIGSGKSTALAALEELGAATLSADAVVHELLGGAAVREAIAGRFGDDVLAADGTIDRSAVAAHAFEHAEDRAWLEGMLWPRVGARIAEWRAEVDGREPSPAAAVVEVPLLFESGMDAAFDATIAILADDAVRADRAAARGHEAVDERTARQLGQEEKAQRATYGVHNSGSLEELEEKLSDVLAKLSS
jgi:dephospho-CoA kinase